MHQRLKTLLLFILLPTCVFAHGEEVLTELLTTAFFFVESLVLFFAAVLVIPLPYAEKALLTIVHLTTIGLVTYWTSGWSYCGNMILVNTLIGLVPVLTTVSTYLLMRVRRKQRQGGQIGC